MRPCPQKGPLSLAQPCCPCPTACCACPAPLCGTCFRTNRVIAAFVGQQSTSHLCCCVQQLKPGPPGRRRCAERRKARLSPRLLTWLKTKCWACTRCPRWTLRRCAEVPPAWRPVYAGRPLAAAAAAPPPPSASAASPSRTLRGLPALSPALSAAVRPSSMPAPQ